MSTIDAWWKRHFPPNSGRRLLFLVIVAPVIAASIGLAQDQLAGPRSWFIGIAVDLMLCLTWFVARGKVAEPPTREPRRLSSLADLVLTASISCAGMVVFLLLMSGEATLTHLPIAIIAGGLLTTAIVFRYSIWPLVLISVVVGYGVAVVLQLFLYWLGGDESILVYWLFSSLTVFAFLMPMWWGVRNARSSLEKLSIPSWVIATGTVILLMLGAAFAGFGASETARAPSAAVPPAPSPPVDVATLGAATPEEASERLLQAWLSSSKDAAARVARSTAVAALFVEPADPAATFKGCGSVFGGWSRCVIAAGGELILLAPELGGYGRTYIAFVERRPLDFPVSYVDKEP
jgi:hypothetical protein